MDFIEMMQDALKKHSWLALSSMVQITKSILEWQQSSQSVVSLLRYSHVQSANWVLVASKVWVRVVMT